jgi:hypothetical protein
MGFQVVNGAALTCSFGTGPSSLIVPPANKTMAGMMPAANIMDFKPVVNVPPFVMCTTPSNPAVAAATTAALGVLTPVPCVPVIPAPWAPGCPKVMIGMMPALNDASTCACTWGGVITVSFAGQTAVQIP